jgi:hypothetical protein
MITSRCDTCGNAGSGDRNKESRGWLAWGRVGCRKKGGIFDSSGGPRFHALGREVYAVLTVGTQGLDTLSTLSYAFVGSSCGRERERRWLGPRLPGLYFLSLLSLSLSLSVEKVWKAHPSPVPQSLPRPTLRVRKRGKHCLKRAPAP